MRTRALGWIVASLLVTGCSNDSEDTGPAAAAVSDTKTVAEIVEAAVDATAGADDATANADVPPRPPPDPNFAVPANGWYRGDLHTHPSHSDGEDGVAVVLDIADAYRDATWAEAFPETSQDFLHFVAVTDHRTTDGHQDPDFGHESLVVIGGEEFGSTGHAGIWGHQEHISHESQAGESNNERLSDAVNEAHEAGALFSPNHPLYAGDLWGWDTPGFDAIEVWNGPWSTLSEPTTETQLDEWVASQGVENAAIRVAAQHEGAGQNAQAIRFWQAWLSLDVHVPPVGGGVSVPARERCSS